MFPARPMKFISGQVCFIQLHTCVYIAKKWPRPFGRDHSFISTILCFASALRLPLSSTNCFVCNFFSSSVGFNLCSCFFRLTLVFRFRFRRLWAVHSTACAASFPLSDPRCFSFLSSASVLGSDYSASAFPFLLFPVPPRSCFPGARFRSRFLGFPFLPGLISHAFLPGSCTRLRCSFPFALPCFAPTAVPQVLAFRFRLRHFPFPARFLSSARLPLPATQPLFFLSFSSRFRLTAAFPVPDSAFASSVSPFSPA